MSSKILSSTEKIKPKDDKKKGDASPSINVSDSKPVSFKPYVSNDHSDKGRNGLLSPKNNSSPSPVQFTATGRSDGTKESSSKTSTPLSSSSGTSPVIQSGIEVLAGHGKDSSLGKLGGLDTSNPAFRPPGLPGYPSSLGHPGVCRDPYCRDPTCPTASYNAYLARLTSASSGAGLPPGYLELLEAYKMYTPGMPPTSVPSPTSASLGPGGPYICNWMNGREYCGKRYTNAEELLVHLKTHTNLSVSDSQLASSSLGAAYSSLFSGAGAAAAAAAASLRGPYPSALSLAASRYSPYGKPGYPSPLPPSLSSLGLPSGPPGLPPSFHGLSPYLSSLGAANPLSLYSLYGGRL